MRQAVLEEFARPGAQLLMDEFWIDLKECPFHDVVKLEERQLRTL